MARYKKCLKCKKSIAGHSKTGYCREHYQKHASNKTCERCSMKLSLSNRSGLCKKHRFEKYQENPEYRKRRSEIGKLYAKNNKEKHRKKSLEWQKANPERVKEIRQKTMSGLNNRFTRAKYTAEVRRNLKWSITKTKYSILISNPCFYCGGKLNKIGVGLDRIDNKAGYSLDNVVPCCGDCNKIRGDRLTSKEMKIAMNAVINFRLENGRLDQDNQ